MGTPPHFTTLWVCLRGQGASAPPLAWVVRVLLQPSLLAHVPYMYLDGQPPYAASIHRLPASPSMSHRRATVVPIRRRAIATRRAPSGCRLAVPTSRPPPLAATGILGLTCRTATGITEPTQRCGASCTFILSLQRHGRKKVGSLRSAICLLAADV